MDELKPCPFCLQGGDPAIKYAFGWFVECQECGIRTGAWPEIENCLHRWNMRTAPLAPIPVWITPEPVSPWTPVGPYAPPWTPWTCDGSDIPVTTTDGEFKVGGLPPTTAGDFRLKF